MAAVVVLPEPCSPTSMMPTGGGRVEVEPVACPRAGSPAPPSISTRWSWTILTTIWPGVTERTTSWPTAFSRTRVDEVAHHRQRDIGLEQRDADLAHRRADIVLAQRAAAAQPVEDVARGDC